MNQTIEGLIADLRKRNEAAGTSVRCPQCNVGIGKYCRDKNGQAIVHPARVTLARSR